MIFSERLKDLRILKGMTQSSLAAKLGVALQSYQRYEQGDRFPKPEILIAIADILDVSLDYLMGRTDKL